MKRTLISMGLLLAILAGAVTFVAYAQTPVPLPPGPPGDFVSKTYGGSYEGRVYFRPFFNASGGIPTPLTEVTASPITPATSFMRLTGTGFVTPSAIITTVAVPGDVLILFNAAATNIHIADTSATGVRLNANINLGVGDTLTLEYGDLFWNQIAAADN